MFFHAVFPVSCTTCRVPLHGDPIPFFCAACWSKIRPFTEPRCPRCSRPFDSPLSLRYSPQHHCGDCRTRPPAYTRAWALYPYQSPLKEAIRLFKYHGKVSLTTPLAHLMLRALPDLPVIDGILPVPLSPNRLRNREYNQSALLAFSLSRHLHIPLILSILIRSIETVPQTSLNRRARLRNLRGAFAIQDSRAIQGKSLLIVDDVWTTGTTINECAKTLRKAGSGPIYALTMTRLI